MEDDLLSPENVVLLYVFWSSIDYSDYYINDLTDSNPKIYYINLDLPRSYVIQSFYYAASNVVAHVWLINTLIGSRFIQDLIFEHAHDKNQSLATSILKRCIIEHTENSTYANIQYT
ncbi:hypothetical protein RI543_004136 [Arxiozyma heterogenica]|uniref:Uncharacterized protein n=1 Tax=Arxiozyma heterogenica TaxID=278026 RepID=A0AAN8A7T6_9SACH|nr:hypothetical protein RI543_004136 [Kazachstania heterogenica]